MIYTEEFCNQQYNPRLSVKNHLDIMQGWQRKSEYARATWECFLDVVYGPDQDEKLDVFIASQPYAPCLIFIHGGYWRGSDKSEFSFIAKAFAKSGATVFLLNYGLAPRVTLETIVSQVYRGVQWVYDNAHQYGGNAEQLFLTGHSAGGHLTAMMMTKSWANQPGSIIKGAIPLSGLFDLEPLVHASFLNTVLQLDIPRAQHLSPIHFRPLNNIPFWTCVGGDESAEFHRQNELIATTWPENFQGDIRMPGCNHFDLMDAFAQPESGLYQAVLKMLQI
jgi:arylformamidase